MLTVPPHRAQANESRVDNMPSAPRHYPDTDCRAKARVTTLCTRRMATADASMSQSGPRPKSGHRRDFVR